MVVPTHTYRWRKPPPVFPLYQWINVCSNWNKTIYKNVEPHKTYAYTTMMSKWLLHLDFSLDCIQRNVAAMIMWWHDLHTNIAFIMKDFKRNCCCSQNCRVELLARILLLIDVLLLRLLHSRIWKQEKQNKKFWSPISLNRPMYCNYNNHHINDFKW